MGMTEALRARIKAAGIAQVHWGVAPENTALPYVVLQVISDPRSEHLKGFNGARQTRVQADAFAATYTAARALAQTLIGAVAPPATSGGVQFGRTQISGPIDLSENTSTGFLHRLSTDLLVEHKST